ncbi:MAG TPA: branched-chain amino acid ABC transporter permease [bacterium]
MTGRPRAWLMIALGLGVLAALPLLSTGGVLTWGFQVLLFVALAQSWNVLGGFGGQVSLGHAAFFGLGAVVTRMVWLSGHPLAVALPAGMVAATMAGVLIGAPTLRLRGPYFAIGTLAVAEILRITVGNVLPEVSTLSAPALAGYTLVPRYLLALMAAVLSTLVAWMLTQTRFGYGLAVVRDDEAVAEAVGVNAFRHKLAVFVLSSALAGLTGGVFGYYHVSFYPQFAFSPLWTFDALLITFFGGTGTVWGPPFAAAVYLLFREALALRLVELHVLVFGIVFVLVVLAFPGGLVAAWRAFGPGRLRQTHGS